MNIRSPLFRNVTALVAAQALIKVLNFAISIAVVRHLGAQELGRYAYILAFAYPFGAVADFGLATLAIREISRERSREGVVTATLSRLLMPLTACSAIAMLAVAGLTRHDPQTLFGLAIVGVSSLLSALTTPSLVILIAREEMHLLSLQRIAASVVGSLATLAVLLGGGTVLPLLLAAAATSLSMLGLARHLVGRPRQVPRIPAAAAWSMLHQALPFGLLMLGFAFYYRIDMVMLQWLRGSREVGLYAAAYRFLDAVVVLAASVGGPFFPRLSRAVARNPVEARELLENAWRPLLALGLPLSFGTFLLANDLTVVFFGREFTASADILRVLILGALPLFWVTVANHALIAADRVWSLAGIYASSALINIAFNLVLIPALGGLGASLATLLCEWLNLALAVGLIRRKFAVSFSVEGVWRYLSAVAGMAVVLWFTRGLGLPMEILAGILAYGGCLVLLGYLGSSDMLAVKWLLSQ